MSLSPRMIRNQKERSRQLGWMLPSHLYPDPPKEENKSVSVQAVNEKLLKSSNLKKVGTFSYGEIWFILWRLLCFALFAFIFVYILKFVIPRVTTVLSRVFLSSSSLVCRWDLGRLGTGISRYSIFQNVFQEVLNYPSQRSHRSHRS